MKQKYMILKNDDAKELKIREFAELDKEILSLLCEETFQESAIKAAMEKGKEALISALRTPNMYPPSSYIEKIAESVIQIYGSAGDQSHELLFDDIEYLSKEPIESGSVEVIEKESAELDELLEDMDDDFVDKDEIKNIDAPLKVAEDDLLDLGEDS